MNNRIIIKYNSETKETAIESNGISFPAARISGIDISELVYPFIVKNNRWNGLYDELKDYYGSDAFSVVFHGSDNDLVLLKQAFTGKPVNVVGLNNKVIILYDSNQLSTKITVNGKIFDTSKLMNRSIDEWIFPFAFKDTEWKGIFTEIENFLGTSSYSIQFIGKSEDMRFIMDNCPENIDITYKAPILQKKMQQPTAPKVVNAAPAKIDSVPKQENQFEKPDMNNVNGKTKGLICGAKTDYLKMKEIDSGLLLFGKIAVAVALVGCLIFIIKMSKLLMLLSLVPTIVFAVLAYKNKYKNIAVATLILCIILAVVSWIIITIRWKLFWKGVSNDMDGVFSDVNDTFNDINDAMN